MEVTIALDGKPFRIFKGTVKHEEPELVIAEVTKQIICQTFRPGTKASFQASDNLIPIENRIKAVKQVRKRAKS